MQIKNLGCYRTRKGLEYDCQFITDINLAQAAGPLQPSIDPIGARGVAFKMQAESEEEAKQKLAEAIGSGDYI